MSARPFVKYLSTRARLFVWKKRAVFRIVAACKDRSPQAAGPAHAKTEAEVTRGNKNQEKDHSVSFP